MNGTLSAINDVTQVQVKKRKNGREGVQFTQGGNVCLPPAATFQACSSYSALLARLVVG